MLLIDLLANKKLPIKVKHKYGYIYEVINIQFDKHRNCVIKANCTYVPPGCIQPYKNIDNTYHLFNSHEWILLKKKKFILPGWF